MNQNEAETASRLTGVSRKPSAFRVITAERHPDPETVMDLLTGRAIVHRVRGYLSKEACGAFAANANELMNQARHDQVPGIKLGADHFGKTKEEYFAEVEATEQKVNGLFKGSVNVPEKLRFDIQRCLDPGMAVRRAESEGRLAGNIRAVKWTGAGSLSLGIHDDNSQLTAPEQADFEIQEVRVPVAANIYPVAEPGCGKLRVFNFRVDPAEKAKLGISHTGYPYPEDLLAGLQYFDVEIEPGDLVLLDGRYLHGVTAGTGDRLLLNCFIGLLRDGASVVTWT